MVMMTQGNLLAITLGHWGKALQVGVIASLASVAAVLAPLVLTGVFEQFVNNKGPYFPGAPFFIAAVLIIAIIPLMLCLNPRRILRS